jgi:hypothetical protein
MEKTYKIVGEDISDVKKKRREIWGPENSLPHDQITKTNDSAWISAEPRRDWVRFVEAPAKEGK